MIYELECPCCEIKIRSSSGFILGEKTRCYNCGNPDIPTPSVTHEEEEVRDRISMWQLKTLNKYLEVHGAEDGPVYVYLPYREDETDFFVEAGIWERCRDRRLAKMYYSLTPLGLRILHDLNVMRRNK